MLEKVPPCTLQALTGYFSNYRAEGEAIEKAARFMYSDARIGQNTTIPANALTVYTPVRPVSCILGIECLQFQQTTWETHNPNSNKSDSHYKLDR